MIHSTHKMHSPVILSIIFLLTIQTSIKVAASQSKTALDANQLISEIQESRVAIGKHLSEVSSSLQPALSGGAGVEQFEKELQQLDLVVRQQISMFDAKVVEPVPSILALQDGYMEYMKWQRDELPSLMKAACAAGQRAPTGSINQRSIVQTALQPVVEQETDWLSRLDRLGAAAILAVPPPPQPREIESDKSILYHLGRQLTSIAIILLFSGGVVWMIISRSLRKPRNRAPRSTQYQRHSSDDPY